MLAPLFLAHHNSLDIVLRAFSHYFHFAHSKKK